MSWEVVIGLEIHTQLATRSKLFSGAATAYGASPNTQACAVDLGLPGVLPVLNRAVVDMAVKFGLAIGADITRTSVFARKNYFYPDLPKGYQISQYELPIVSGGQVEIELEGGHRKTIRVTRAHMEEDAGKSEHKDFHGYTGIDLNRAGTPLLEIVSEPDMRSAKEAVAYAKKIHSLVRYLDVSDGNMQEGSFRCDINISLRQPGGALGTRAEIKNVNSFRFLERAIVYEIGRQSDVLESGGKVVQETRLYDPDADKTIHMRFKEDADDYRYFPDPDLLPVQVDEATIERIRASMPELPDARKNRFIEQYGLKPYDAELLTAAKEVAAYYEQVVAMCGDGKLAANWVNGELMGSLNKMGLDFAQSKLSAERLGGLLALLTKGRITGKIAKQVYLEMWDGGQDAETIIKEKGLIPIADTGAIEQIIDAVIASNPQQVEQYRSGKDKLFGFFVGLVMKQSQGKADPKTLNELLKKKLVG